MGLKSESIGLGFLVFVLLAIQPSACGPFENENLMTLSERFDELKTNVESLKAENKLLNARIECLERKDAEKVAKIKEQEEQIIQLKAMMDFKFESTQSTGPSRDELVIELGSSKANRMSLISRKEESSDDSSTRAFLPSSCRELSLIGHSLDGLYLVQNVDTKKIETVLCSFGPSISQDLIGHVDVKTKNAHFYVQRNSGFGMPNAVIPFDVARLNEGNAFDLPSGIFTVPVAGIYHFDFSAVTDANASYLDISLQVNGAYIGIADTSQSAADRNAVSLSASLRLEAGDKVNLLNGGNGILFDNGSHSTHFRGWLVEEELM